jgi:hypothetical protein
MEKTSRNAKSRYETKTADTSSTTENKRLQTEFDTALNHIKTAKRALNYGSYIIIIIITLFHQNSLSGSSIYQRTATTGCCSYCYW